MYVDDVHVTINTVIMYSLSFLDWCRVSQDSYDTNRMAEELTNDFFDQAFTVGQQVL